MVVQSPLVFYYASAMIFDVIVRTACPCWLMAKLFAQFAVYLSSPVAEAMADDRSKPMADDRSGDLIVRSIATQPGLLRVSLPELHH